LIDSKLGEGHVSIQSPTKENLVKTVLQVCVVFLVLCGWSPMTARASQFPIEIRDLSLEEAMALPGARGAYGTLSAIKPAHVKQMPECKSRHPLFGLIHSDGMRASGGSGMVFLFDESMGTGKGYDRLVVDQNKNGDLTDDPVWERTGPGSGEVQEHFEQQRFGPVVMPESISVGAWRPRLFVEIYVFNRELLRAGTGDMLHHIGQMRVCSGNLLVANVEVNGVNHRLGIVDGNLNFRIGDPATVAEFTRSPGRTTWYLMPADYLLRDADRPGRDTIEPLSSIAYFGGNPFSVTLAEDLKWIGLEPYAGVTGELELGEEVTRFILGRQMAGGNWEALSPALEKGKAILPAGTYRVSNLMIESRDTRKIQLTSYDVPLKPFEIVGDQTRKVGIGAPIRLEVTAEKRSARPGEGTRAGVMEAVRGMFGARGSGVGETVLQLGVTVFGQADELFSGFGSASERHLSPPRFEILSEGKSVGAGDFEYG
jgi:hypothetical protein